jgi:hypothetical protein
MICQVPPLHLCRLAPVQNRADQRTSSFMCGLAVSSGLLVIYNKFVSPIEIAMFGYFRASPSFGANPNIWCV